MKLLLNSLKPEYIETLTGYFDKTHVAYDDKSGAYFVPKVMLNPTEACDLEGLIQHLGVDLTESVTTRFEGKDAPLNRLTIDNLMLLIDYLDGFYIDGIDYFDEDEDDEDPYVDMHMVGLSEAGQLGYVLSELNVYLHDLIAKRDYLTLPNEAA